jgi:hypothetical protein
MLASRDFVESMNNIALASSIAIVILASTNQRIFPKVHEEIGDNPAGDV